TNPNCGFTPMGQHCPCYGHCPKHKVGKGKHGPNDPINLGQLEENYSPDPDLVVYNPIGPSVVWNHTYNSLKGSDPASEFTDYGMGFSQNYNVGVYDPNATPAPLISQNGSASFAASGADSPGSGLTWDIVRNGSTVASSAARNSWSVTWTGSQF